MKKNAQGILTPNDYRDALKSGINGGWLFFGEEAYLKQHALEQTRKAFAGDNAASGMSCKKLSCLDFDIEKMTDAVATVSLLDIGDGEKRLTEFHELCFGQLKEAEWKQLEDLLSELDAYPDTTLIIYTTPEELDEGNLPKAPSKTFSRLTQYLTPVWFAREDGTKLLKWITKHFTSAKLKTEAGACELLLDRVGHDMYALSNEIDKLCAYLGTHGKDTLMCSDVENVTCSNIESDSFSFTNALLSRDCDRAYELLNEMILKKEKAVVILGAIARTATDLYTVKELYSSGMTVQEIAKKLKIHEYRAKLYVQYSKERTPRKLRSLVDECYDIDIKMKNSSLDEYTMLSRLVVLFAAK